MWRKQPEVKPSSPVNPGNDSYAPVAQRPVTSSAPAPVSAPQQSFVPPPSNSAVLTRGICIKGELTGKADLLIDGEVKGSIRLGDSRLTVGQAGRIQADIEASEIHVKGQVNGDLRGRERVVLGNSCRVEGDLEAPRIVIEDGAHFKGRVEMGPSADARERINKKAPQAASRETVSSDTVSAVPVETQRS